jgi:uncharacterized protein
MLDVSAVEVRILGSLIEKQRTTPDAYPLTLNALRAACNQSTSRDPVVQYDDTTLREALERLGRRGWTRLASGPHSRSPKYRHLLDEALSLGVPEQSVLAVLMLRGAQTSAELRARTERLHPFASVAAVDDVLAALADRGLARLNERRPGEREARWQQLVSSDAGQAPVPRAAETPAAISSAPAPAETASLADRVRELEAQVADLTARLDELEADA